jgi:hypothetical protein
MLVSYKGKKTLLCDTNENKLETNILKLIIMKAKNIFIGTIALVAISFFTSCDQQEVTPSGEDYGILPERFKVDIPSSISSSEMKSTSFKSTNGDTLSGNEIYEHLTNFIAIGEGSADLVELIIIAIKVHKIDQVKTLSYVSDEDNRLKNLVVHEGVEYSNRIWEYQLTVTDAESEGNEDGGIGMQVFWNKSPIAGIAVIKPYNMNRKDDKGAGDAIYKVEYSEEGTDEYEAYMVVEIAGIPLPSAEQEPFAVNAIKMFVGKKGDRVDVYGNSNHPNAQFNYHDGEAVGFNWAFVASGFESSDIGVAEVGLPASNADISSREAILVDNSIESVLSREMTNYIVAEYAAIGITLDPAEVATYIAPFLKNADAPGYFNNKGFVQAGTSPGEAYNELETSILELTPYNPLSIAELTIEFK